jgi:hypothetical protein
MRCGRWLRDLANTEKGAADLHLYVQSDTGGRCEGSYLRGSIQQEDRFSGQIPPNGNLLTK